MSDHEELESSVAAWVLGAVDETEAEAIWSHVEGCATCTEVAIRLRRVAGVLPLAVEEVNPPGRLRDRVLAGAAASRHEHAPAAVNVRRREPTQPPAPGRAAFARRIPGYALAAVALIALLVGIIVGQVAPRAPQPPPSTQVARFSLAGHQEMSGAQATVIDLKSDGLALVDFRGLPPPGAGRVYEVWLIPGKGDPVPAAVFVPDSNGAKVVIVSRSLAGYTVMAVTNEAGPDGARAPTQQPQLYGNVA
jgi:anti-sigma-K factor RskA